MNESGGLAETELLAPRPQSPVRLYVIAAIVCFAAAGLIWTIAQPEERMGPPTGQQTGQQTGEHTHAPGAEAQNPHGEGFEELQAKITELRGSVRNGSASSDEVLLLANLLYDQGMRTESVESFAESSALYERYLVDNPDNPDARTDYAFTLFKIGDLDGSIAELQRVRASHPDHQYSSFNMAIMYMEKEMPDSVLHYMSVTAQIDSTTRIGQQAIEVLRAHTGAD